MWLIYVFGGIALVIFGVGIWMTWYSRRALRQHRRQVEEIVEEMEAMEGDRIRELRREDVDG